jgi:hypothetical protein
MIDRILWRRLDSPGHEIATLEAPGLYCALLA